MKTTKLLGLFALALLLTGPVFGAANIVIVNVNAPGVGFNDPTPAAPVGGNPGTTVGQQALNVFQYAANVWGSILDSPVTIYIQASFVPLACTPGTSRRPAASVTVGRRTRGRAEASPRRCDGPPD